VIAASEAVAVAAALGVAVVGFVVWVLVMNRIDRRREEREREATRNYWGTP
jgi:hypothetical protein